MRIAHIILVHKNPMQTLRLVRRLAHPDSDVYIHIDYKVDAKEFEVLLAPESVIFINDRVECTWGGNSISIAISKAIAQVVNSGLAYDFINLISAQDYPIVSANQMHAFLKNNLGKNFISFDNSKDTEWWASAIDRYRKYHYTDFKFRYKNTIANIFSALLPTRKFPLELEVFGGNKGTWWTISGDCAAYIYKHFLSNKKLNTFLKFCWGTDELIVPTFVMNSPYKENVVNNNLRYIDWSEGKASPKILTSKDLENITRPNNLFARKFDVDIDAKVLDMIDNSNQYVSLIEE